jgi:hypothetical protein
VLNQSSCHEDVLGSGNIAPGFLIGALESEWPRFGRFTAEVKTIALIGNETKNWKISAPTGNQSSVLKVIRISLNL